MLAGILTRPSSSLMIAAALFVCVSQVGRDNPSELKAQKLARSLARGAIDRDLKPNSDERKSIALVLKLPPNRYADCKHCQVRLG